MPEGRDAAVCITQLSKVAIDSSRVTASGMRVATRPTRPPWYRPRAQPLAFHHKNSRTLARMHPRCVRVASTRIQCQRGRWQMYACYDKCTLAMTGRWR